MSKQELILRKSIDNVISLGIKIIPRSTFIWDKYEDKQPIACNPFGAVLITNLKSLSNWTELADFLNVDFRWMYRFNIGFNATKLNIIVVRPNGNEYLIEDKVNALGLLLRKQYL